VLIARDMDMDSRRVPHPSCPLAPPHSCPLRALGAPALKQGNVSTSCLWSYWGGWRRRASGSRAFLHGGGAGGGCSLLLAAPRPSTHPQVSPLSSSDNHRSTSMPCPRRWSAVSAPAASPAHRTRPSTQRTPAAPWRGLERTQSRPPAPQPPSPPAPPADPPTHTPSPAAAALACSASRPENLDAGEAARRVSARAGGVPRTAPPRCVVGVPRRRAWEGRRGLKWGSATTRRSPPCCCQLCNP
jgi:hypothetical protein